eukprot:TRINITY_DN31676_c0_g1_i1.p1 TRINITY_DN31676_c0_g1~~TRINITY_DN31676_c0_g1_i1.p1  ORF type:complete len:322 (-),score=93.57 TRINITY_DN31676_c0_g1_i1:226-1191(-)
MVIPDACNNTDPVEGGFLHLGPSTLYHLFGPTIIVLYGVIIILTIFLWLYALYFRSITSNISLNHITFLQISPVLHITLTLPVLISPPTAPLVSLLQDIVSVLSMLVFTHLTTTLLGGVDNITKLANTTHPTTCPIGTPPLCCLIPCTKPAITPRIVKLVMIPVKLLSVAIMVNFLINMFLVFSGFYPSRVFGNITNLHNILIIPFFISCMYSYKVFISVTSAMLPNTNHTLRGILIFIMFVFCKSSFGIINMLIDTSVVPCLPGLSSVWMGMLLVTLIQVVGVSIIALVIPRLYARNWATVMFNMEEGDLVEQSKLVRVA